MASSLIWYREARQKKKQILRRKTRIIKTKSLPKTRSFLQVNVKMSKSQSRFRRWTSKDRRQIWKCRVVTEKIKNSQKITVRLAKILIIRASSSRRVKCKFCLPFNANQHWQVTTKNERIDHYLTIFTKQEFHLSSTLYTYIYSLLTTLFTLMYLY